MANTFSKSTQLTKESFSIIRKNKKILLLPIAFFTTIILLIILFFIQSGFLLDTLIYTTHPIYTTYTTYAVFVSILVYYILGCFTFIFFNAWIINYAYAALKKEKITFIKSFKNTAKHIKKIFIWSLISGTLGGILIILGIIFRGSKTINKIYEKILNISGIAWDLLTFFIIPIILFENLDIPNSIKRSGYLFKKSWGENLAGQFSMDYFFLFLYIIVTVPLLLWFIGTGSGAAFLLTWAYWIFLGLFGSVLGGIFTTALYIYAASGEITSDYNPEFIKNNFVPSLPPTSDTSGKNAPNGR